MSEPGKAVFLSYASQDAESARRICETLRAAGVEVWFDQSELVGGDVWDAKIKKQIRECTLFVPVISANTQVRLEGYFRLEWKLAAQRTHTMAAAKAFLLPVVIDETRESEAHVPEEFCAVQWTSLRGGVATTDFVRRVQLLLDAPPPATNAPFPMGQSRSPVPPRRRFGGLAVAIAAGGVVLAVALWHPWRDADRPAGSVAPPAPATRLGADEVAQLRQRLIPDQWQKEDFAVVSSALDRLLQANPELAEGWALRSIIHSLQTIRQFDRGAKPLEVGKSAADRALRLTPDLPLGELAVGLHLVAMLSRGGDDDAYRTQLDLVLAKLPRDGLTRFTELLSYYHAYDFSGTERSGRAWLEAEPKAVFPAWILSSTYVAKRQPAEAERWAEAAVGETNITGIRSHVTRFEVHYYLRADLAKARAALDLVPPNGRTVHRVVHAQWLLAMAEQRWDEALQLLMRLPEALFSDRSYHGPRALLAGLAHRSALRPEAAATQFREAERLLRELLTNDPDNEPLHAALAVTLACENRAADARSALGHIEPLVSGRSPSLYRGPLVVMIAQAYREMNDLPGTARWLRKLFVEPSDVPFTPASLRLDARFNGVIDAPEIQAMLREVGGDLAGPKR
jgi:tetratricopeptide (TPR) repeat protein